jgi:hypothetical protein
MVVAGMMQVMTVVPMLITEINDSGDHGGNYGDDVNSN